MESIIDEQYCWSLKNIRVFLFYFLLEPQLNSACWCLNRISLQTTLHLQLQCARGHPLLFSLLQFCQAKTHLYDSAYPLQLTSNGFSPKYQTRSLGGICPVMLQSMTPGFLLLEISSCVGINQECHNYTCIIKLKTKYKLYSSDEIRFFQCSLTF